MKNKKNSSLIRFLQYVKPYWIMIIIAAVGGIIKFTLPLIFPQVLKYFIDYVLNPENNIPNSQRLLELNKWSGIVIGIYLFIWMPGTFVRHYFAGKLGHKVIFNLRHNLFLHIQRMSASYFNKYHSGAIVSRVINDIILAQNMVGNALTNIWMDGTVIIVLLALMIKMDPVLTLVSISIFPFYILMIKKLGTLVKDNSRKVQDEIEEMTGNLQEKISGYSVIQTFTRELTERKLFFQESRKLLSHSIRSAKLSSINFMVTGFLTGAAPILVVWVGGQRIISGNLTIGELVAFYSYLGMFYFPINRFSELNVVFSTSMAAIDRVFEVFDMEPDVQDKEDAIDCPKDLKGHIKFENVSFSYDKENPTLEKINLEIYSGQKVALIGSSGAGKSSLINLIPRFYECDAGSIKIDGKDIQDYKIRSLRQNIGMVLQNVILFSGTIRENIAYGNPKASEKEIIAAAKAANAYDFIRNLPEGFDTQVGEGGARLSGGQKQRIAISRVFNKNPKILILDEATSALDSESENLIQEALNRLMKGRTTIIIAHRLSTIMDADIIVAMDNGEIKEMGRHEDLLKKEGIYKKLFEEQFRNVKMVM